MNWQMFEFWQFLELSAITLIGLLGITTLFLTALWSIKIDKRQIYSIRYNPRNYKDYSLRSVSMRSNLTHQTTESSCPDNAPINPSTFASKTPSHTPQSTIGDIDESTKSKRDRKKEYYLLMVVLLAYEQMNVQFNSP